ncbi:hypothetical protein SJAG_02459, partial [Schizosaccharomyces japonicus yFS275]
KPVCPYFVKGNCKFGAKCALLHPKAKKTSSGAAGNSGSGGNASSSNAGSTPSSSAVASRSSSSAVSRSSSTARRAASTHSSSSSVSSVNVGIALSVRGRPVKTIKVKTAAAAAAADGSAEKSGSTTTTVSTTASSANVNVNGNGTVNVNVPPAAAAAAAPVIAPALSVSPPTTPVKTTASAVAADAVDDAPFTPSAGPGATAAAALQSTPLVRSPASFCVKEDDFIFPPDEEITFSDSDEQPSFFSSGQPALDYFASSIDTSTLSNSYMATTPTLVRPFSRFTPTLASPCTSLMLSEQPFSPPPFKLSSWTVGNDAPVDVCEEEYLPSSLQDLLTTEERTRRELCRRKHSLNTPCLFCASNPNLMSRKSLGLGCPHARPFMRGL